MSEGTFTQGIIYAAAEIIRQYGQITAAEGLLHAAGITDDDYKQVADYDLETLRHAGLTTVKTDI